MWHLPILYLINHHSYLFFHQGFLFTVKLGHKICRTIADRCNMGLEEISSAKCFGGSQKVFKHHRSVVPFSFAIVAFIWPNFMANAGQTISTSWCLSAHPTPLPPWKHPINFLTNLTFGKLLFRLNKNSKVKVIQGPDGVVIRAMDAICYIIYDRFHVAVHLFSNRSWMTSKCGKNSLCATFSCNLTTF